MLLAIGFGRHYSRPFTEFYARGRAETEALGVLGDIVESPAVSEIVEEYVAGHLDRLVYVGSAVISKAGRTAEVRIGVVADVGSRVADVALLKSGKRASYLICRTGGKRALKREVERADGRIRGYGECLSRIGIYRRDSARLGCRERFYLLAERVLCGYLKINIYSQINVVAHHRLGIVVSLDELSVGVVF